MITPPADCGPQTTADIPQPRYLGLWREKSGTDDWQIVESWDALNQAHQEHTASLVDIDTFVEDGNRQFGGLWLSDAGTGGEVLTSDAGWLSFIFTQDAQESQGYGLVDVEVFHDAGITRYLAVWRMGEMPTEFIRLNSATAFEAQARDLLATHQMIELETWKENETRWFLGGFRGGWLQRGAGQIVNVSQLWCGFHNDYHGLEGTHRLEDLEFYIDSLGNRRYASVWKEATGRDYLWIGFTADGFTAAEDKVPQRAAGVLLYDLEIIDDPDAIAAQSVGSREPLGERTIEGTEETIILSGDIAIEEDDDDGPISGAPPLHDTGSSGPD